MKHPSKSEKEIGRAENRNSEAVSIDQEIDSNIMKISTMEAKARENRSAGEKIAEVVAVFCGSMTFVYVHIVGFSGWIISNYVLGNDAFDPFPFTFLTLVVSLEAIFLSTFILISQNHETRLTERRNHLDLQINLLAEQESTKTLELIQRIAKKLDVEDDDLRTRALLEPAEPKAVVRRIAEVADETLDAPA